MRRVRKIRIKWVKPIWFINSCRFSMAEWTCRTRTEKAGQNAPPNRACELVLGKCSSWPVSATFSSNLQKNGVGTCWKILTLIQLERPFLSSQRIRKYYLDESELNCKKIESSSRRQIMLLILAMTWGMEIALKLVEGKVVSEGQIQTRHNFLAMKFWQQ